MSAPLEQRLEGAGRRRRQAEHRREHTAAQLHEVVREAAATVGWTKTRIAQVAGISRQAVHDILKEDR